MDGRLCKGLCPLHPQPPLGTVDGFALHERECSQGLRVEIFAENTTRPLTERSDTLPRRGKANSFPLLPHGECGVWGNAPQVKFRDGVRPPFSKGEEDWGLPPAPRFWQQIGRGQSPLLTPCIRKNIMVASKPRRANDLLCRLVRYTYNKVGGISNGKETET